MPVKRVLSSYSQKSSCFWSKHLLLITESSQNIFSSNLYKLLKWKKCLPFEMKQILLFAIFIFNISTLVTTYGPLHGAGGLLAFLDNFWQLLVNLRSLKHASDNLWQHGTIHVSIPQAVREEIADKQTNKQTRSRTFTQIVVRCNIQILNSDWT